MADVVLDSSAVLARILGEPGAERVDEVIVGARLSAVNLAEVIQRLSDRGLDRSLMLEVVADLPCRIEPFGETAGVETGLLRPATREKGLSLGDRACLALARTLAIPCYTCDRVWAELDLGIEVVLIR